MAFSLRNKIDTSHPPVFPSSTPESIKEDLAQYGIGTEDGRARDNDNVVIINRGSTVDFTKYQPTQLELKANSSSVMPQGKTEKKEIAQTESAVESPEFEQTEGVDEKIPIEVDNYVHSLYRDGFRVTLLRDALSRGREKFESELEQSFRRARITTEQRDHILSLLNKGVDVNHAEKQKESFLGNEESVALGDQVIWLVEKVKTPRKVTRVESDGIFVEGQYKDLFLPFGTFKKHIKLKEPEPNMAGFVAPSVHEMVDIEKPEPVIAPIQSSIQTTPEFSSLATGNIQKPHFEVKQPPTEQDIIKKALYAYYTDGDLDKAIEIFGTIVDPDVRDSEYADFTENLIRKNDTEHARQVLSHIKNTEVVERLQVELREQDPTDEDLQDMFVDAYNEGDQNKALDYLLRIKNEGHRNQSLFNFTEFLISESEKQYDFARVVVGHMDDPNQQQEWTEIIDNKIKEDSAPVEPPLVEEQVTNNITPEQVDIPVSVIPTNPEPLQQTVEPVIPKSTSSIIPEKSEVKELSDKELAVLFSQALMNQDGLDAYIEYLSTVSDKEMRHSQLNTLCRALVEKENFSDARRVVQEMDNNGVKKEWTRIIDAKEREIETQVKPEMVSSLLVEQGKKPLQLEQSHGILDAEVVDQPVETPQPVMDTEQEMGQLDYQKPLIQPVSVDASLVTNQEKQDNITTQDSVGVTRFEPTSFDSKIDEINRNAERFGEMLNSIREDEKIKEFRAAYVDLSIAYKQELRKARGKFNNLLSDLGAQVKMPETPALLNLRQNMDEAERAYRNARKKKYAETGFFDKKTIVDTFTNDDGVVEVAQFTPYHARLIGESEYERGAVQNQIDKLLEKVAPQEAGLVRKTLVKFQNIPLAARVAATSALTGIIAGGIAGAGVFGAAAYAGQRVFRGLTGVAASDATGKMVDSIYKKKNKEAENKSTVEYSTDIDLDNFDIKEKERREFFENQEVVKKRQMLKKGAAMAVTGGLTSFLSGAIVKPSVTVLAENHVGIKGSPVAEKSAVDAYVGKKVSMQNEFDTWYDKKTGVIDSTKPVHVPDTTTSAVKGPVASTPEKIVGVKSGVIPPAESPVAVKIDHIPKSIDTAQTLRKRATNCFRMILPIVTHGDPVLRKRARKIESTYPLGCLITDMFVTMTANKGVGLAASQVGKPIRLFVMDTLRHGGYRKAFLNAHIIASSGEEDTAEEGCLSLPDVRKRVTRKREVTVKYQDEDFNVRIEKFTGLEARVIQHEIDHIKGKLIIDYAD
jgi:peptide deformylase